MGENIVPELQDPVRMPEGQVTPRLTDEEVDAKFDALVAVLDAQALIKPQRTAE